MTTRLTAATLMVLTAAGCRPEPSREDVEATAEELLTNVETADELEAALSELIELESRIPIEDRWAEDAERMAELEEVTDEVLTSLRALEEAETTEAEKAGAAVRLRSAERNAAERMARLREGMRSETSTVVENVILSAESATRQARITLEQVEERLDELRAVP